MNFFFVDGLSLVNKIINSLIKLIKFYQLNLIKNLNQARSEFTLNRAEFYKYVPVHVRKRIKKQTKGKS
jgi:transcription termination factor Rho